MIYIILISFGIFLVLYNYKAVRKEESSFLTAFNNEEKISKDYDIELIAIRKDMAESILDLQHEIQELREKIEKTNNITEEIEEEYEIDDLNENNDEKYIKYNENQTDIINNSNTPGVISQINYDNSISSQENNEEHESTTKVEKIKDLIHEGKTDDEICALLNVGKGEVLLIRGLYN